MIDLRVIAARYGGMVMGRECLIPTPGHSSRDRGTAIRLAPGAPDGLLVTCFNGGRLEALAVKDMLRRDGILAADDGKRPELTAAERRAIRQAERDRQRERQAAEELAASGAVDLWSNASGADAAHPYLVRKALEPFGIRQSGDALLVPMVDAGFRLWNVQRIRPNGFKLFCKEARTTGLFWPHGVHMQDGRPSDGPLVIGEGFATVAAIQMATGQGIAAAMSARNLESVARTIRKLFPPRQIIIAADDDSHLPVNLGLNAASKAALAVGGYLATPRPEPRPGDSGADFADIPRDQVAARIASARLGE